MNSINFKINLKNNDNSFSFKEKEKNKNDYLNSEAIQASSLEILSLYKKAAINFKGEIKSNDFQKELIKFEEKLRYEKDEKGNEIFPRKELITYILSSINEENFEFAKELCIGKDENGNDLFSKKVAIKSILDYTKEDEIKITRQLALAKDKNGSEIFPEKAEICFVMEKIREKNIKNPQTYINKLKNCEITPNMLVLMLEKDDFSSNDIKKIKSILNNNILSNLLTDDLYIASKMIDLANKIDVSEIDRTKRMNIIKNLMFLNMDLYSASEELREIFPILPQNKDEYCSLVQNLAKSITYETTILNENEISVFNKSIINLANSLSILSDCDFNMLQITQKYSKDEFIKNVFKIIKDLTPAQQQKIFDYFNFELKSNKYGTKIDENPNNVFSIVGYPTDLKNKEKLAKIKDAEIKEAIEKIQPEVIKFCKNNLVICSNKKLKTDINEILDLCPELRVQIGKNQYKTYDFDTFKHSLKTMQKVAQNPEFLKMNKSDKKVLLLASLLHDCNKTEGYIDTIHPNKSAFDAFYIAKKLGFNEEELNKLYSLIKTHDWLDYVNNKNKKTDELEQRLKSIAYDLYQDNLFEMARILTEASLKAVKENDDFYDKFETLLKANSVEIKKYVNELKSTQPLLPVTKIPSTTRIKEAIKFVKPDGTTNLKGIYQDKNEMVIIKYNEVENETWEKIGFKKGSVSKGIKATNCCAKQENELQKTINTGNIKFFAHGLDYPEQIRNFDVFSFVDSEALLSTSYMERPESKYRLFRTQGVLLDVDTKYIHGGGNSDSASGSKKDLDLFKKAYAFNNNYKHLDRTFISELIKDALNLDDEEYIEFVKNNKNKPLSEIQPKEYQDILIKAFAAINSNSRMGDREYNEVYVTNPKVTGVFAYPITGSVGDVMDFVDKQKDFLKDYALEKKLPFVIFGD